MVGSRPHVSVVTPSFNQARFLPACLASVRSQTYPRLDHLVVDACSADGSADVVRSLAATYDLSLLCERDRGQADALNKGFARARGDVLCWLNADDFWLHDRVVEEAVSALEAGADLVTASGWFVDGAGARLRRWPVRAAWTIPELRYYDGLLQPATFWRRQVHHALRADLHYVFDWRLWLDVQRGGARLVALDREWAAYRMHGVNKTAADPPERRREVADLLADECGRVSLQHLWARGVYQGYRAAERLRSPAARRAVQLANLAMYRLTRRRVFSC